MRLVLGLCFFISFSVSLPAQKNIDGAFTVNGRERVYTVHLPPNYSATNPLPLVFVFHGGGGNHQQIQRHLQMDAVADRENFITVYPNAVNKNWNDGREFDDAVTVNDDAQFINQLLDSLEKNYAVNPQRVFSTGISNGGFFSIFLALKLSSRLRAVAPICASIPEKIYNHFNPTYPVSILFMNGTEDPLVPYAGGDVGNRLIGARGRCMATDSSVQKFIGINGTQTTPVVENLPDADKNDKCTAMRYTYSGGRNNTVVCLVKINGGGHTAPGCTQYLPKFMVGRTCRDFKAPELVWQFFKSR